MSLIQQPLAGMEEYKHQPTPMELLHIAVSRGADIDTIERLAALQEKMLTREAEIEFNEAMNRAQIAMRPVAADLENKQTHSRYASYAAIDKKIRPIYSKEGFSLSFDTGDSPNPDTIRVYCHVSRGAHTRRYQVDMPSDGKGAKGGDVMTKTHATGAAMSYGMRYLLKFIFNISVGEEDDDGNLNNGWLAERLEWMENCRNHEELKRIFQTAFAEAKKQNNAKALLALTQANDKHKERINEGR